MKLFATPAVFFLLSKGPAVHAGINTCSEQAACIDVTITQNGINDIACGDETCLDYEICLKLDYREGCTKTGSISHTCVRDPDACYDGTEACMFGGDDVTEVTNPPVTIGDGYEQCQNVPPGGTAYFLLKDASNCGLPTDPPENFNTPSGETATCNPTRNLGEGECTNVKGADSCTGNMPGRECVWSVTAPGEVCGPPPPVCDPAVECCPSEETCCPSPLGLCETDPNDPCAGFQCPEWICETVCRKLSEPLTCVADVPSATSRRRSLQESAKAAPVHWLRNV